MVQKNTPMPNDRKYPAHGVFRTQNGPTIVFLTVCSKNRIPWIANHSVHETLCTIWTQATAWLVGDYVLMPDHIHLFATPTQECTPLDNWVRYWKSRFTWLDQNPSHSWQRNHWDTRLRSSVDYQEKLEYVRNNPVRKELVDDPDEWLFQGCIHSVYW